MESSANDNQILGGDGKSSLFIGLFFGLLLFGLSFPLIIIPEEVVTGKLIALSFFGLVSTLFTILPLVSRLEIGPDYIRPHLWGVYRPLIKASDVTRVWFAGERAGMYGTIMMLHINTLQGKKYRLAVGLFTREALEQAKAKLENSKKIEPHSYGN